jgi:hypothetical protein
MYLLGYIARDNRIYLCDKDQSIYSYSLPVSVIEYQTAVLRGDFDAAVKILPSVPVDQRNKIARFLESQDLKEEALKVSTDYDHKFDLAIGLDRLDIAHEIAGIVDSEEKWKVVGDAALARWEFDMAEACMIKAGDIEGLLLMYQATGNRAGMRVVAEMAESKGKNNVAFMCHLVLGNIEACIEILVGAARFAEAALMARTYLPSDMERLVGLWKDGLVAEGKGKIAGRVGDGVCEDLEYGLFAEKMFREGRGVVVGAGEYGKEEGDVLVELKEKYPGGVKGVTVEKMVSKVNGVKPLIEFGGNGDVVVENGHREDVNFRAPMPVAAPVHVAAPVDTFRAPLPVAAPVDAFVATVPTAKPVDTFVAPLPVAAPFKASATASDDTFVSAPIDAFVPPVSDAFVIAPELNESAFSDAFSDMSVVIYGVLIL